MANNLNSSVNQGSTNSYEKTKEIAEKYKTYMSSNSQKGWGSQKYRGDHKKIGPNELIAMRNESGLSEDEINNFFSSEEGQGYLSNKSQRMFKFGGANTSSGSSSPGQSAAQDYKNDFIANGFDASSRTKTNDKSKDDSYNKEDFNKMNNNEGVIGGGTNAAGNSGLIGSGEQITDNQGQVGDYNADDSYNTDVQAQTERGGQGGLNNTNIRSPFGVQGDLMNRLGNQSTNAFTLNNSQFGDFAKIGNDYSVTIGTIGNGNNMGTNSNRSNNSGMEFMQTAAAYGALNSNAQARSSDQLNGMERGVIAGALSDSVTGTSTYNRNAYNSAAQAALNFRNRSDVTKDKLYGNMDFGLSGWMPLRSPKKPEDKTEEIADNFN